MRADTREIGGVKVIAMRRVERLLGCSRPTVYRLIDRGDLDEVRYCDGGWRWVSQQSIDRYLRKAQQRRARRPRSKGRDKR